MTGAQHKSWREKIELRFGHYINYDDTFLLLIKFINNSPQKYFDTKAADEFLIVLEDALAEDAVTFASIMTLKEAALSISCKTLNDINGQEIHEMLLPDATYERITFIDERIHYSLLRILEGPIYHWLHLYASYILVKQGKKTEGIDLYNCFQVIAKTPLSFIEPVFDKVVRNAIAHGKVSYGNTDVTYYDKNTQKELSYRAVVALFDKLLDIANALTLGFELFYIKHQAELSTNGIELPQAIKVEELGLRCDAPRWEIKGCFETPVIGDRRQLTVFVKDECIQYDRAFYQGIITAAWAESLTPGYDRYSIRMTSKYAMGGHGAFTGEMLRSARLAQAPVGEYALALEENLFMYWPLRKWDGIVYKAVNFWDIMRIVIPVAIEDYRNKLGKGDIICKDVEWHSRATHIVVSDASITLVKHQDDYKNFVRTNRKKLIKLAVKQVFSEMSIFNWRQILPIRFLRLRIYDTELRVRDLRESGLGANLICMITVNLTDNIRNIDIMGSVAEQHGTCRIMWNRKWLQKMGEPVGLEDE
jgi:hypothetical protein